ncbi:MAG: hypothetical protein ACKO51_05790 [Alphaproteobacteria bacterium]
MAIKEAKITVLRKNFISLSGTVQRDPRNQGRLYFKSWQRLKVQRTALANPLAAFSPARYSRRVVTVGLGV